MTKRATIKDIAHELNISTSTVSRALADQWDVNPDTRRAVLEVAKRLNYRSNPISLRLRSRQTWTVGVVVPEFINSYFAEILIGMQRVFFPKVHLLLLKSGNAAFYLWGVALAIVSGQTVRSLANSNAPASVEWLIALAGLIACCIQFYLGKRIGGHYKERISGGQALGQKNTVLAIWMAYTYLNPLASVGPGSYVLWQNSINSWQLWKKRKKEEQEQKQGDTKIGN